MNLSDIFYVVAIVYMTINVIIIIAFFIFLVGLIKKTEKITSQFQESFKKASVLRYSLELSILQKIIKLFKGGGKQ